MAAACVKKTGKRHKRGKRKWLKNVEEYFAINEINWQKVNNTTE